MSRGDKPIVGERKKTRKRLTNHHEGLKINKAGLERILETTDRLSGEQHRKRADRGRRKLDELGHGKGHRVGRREGVGNDTSSHQNSVVHLDERGGS